MDPYSERMAAFEAWWARVRAFRARPFPTDWARVVAGVGLASFSMRVERTLEPLPAMYCWKPDYLHRIGLAQSTVKELRELHDGFAPFLPALPPEPRAYFEEFRALVADALALTEEWWAAAPPDETATA